MDAIVIAGYECEALLFSLLQAGRLCAPREGLAPHSASPSFMVSARRKYSLIHAARRADVKPSPSATPVTPGTWGDSRRR